MTWRGSTYPWEPDQISNLTAWYRADRGITLNSGNVSQWNDLSGNGNHLTQSTASAQPLWNHLDATFNNQASVEGDGTTEYMTTAAFTGGDITQPFTAVVVGIRVSGTERNIFAGITAAKDCEFGIESGANAFVMNAGDGDESLSASSTDARIHIVLFNGASSDSWMDGVQATPAATPGAEALSGLTFLARQDANARWDGEICEMMFFDANVSDADKNRIGNYCQARYGITWTAI